MNTLLKLSGLAVSVLLSGCITTEAPDVYHAASVPGPSAGHAVVIFYREGQWGGSLIPFKIWQDGRKIGRLGSGEYFRWEVGPGPHSFSASMTDAVTKTWNLESGHSYFLRVGIHANAILYQPHLTLVDPQEGASALPKLKQTAPGAG